MIAAPRSGSGKTMVTCGILELLKRKGKHPFSINADRIILTGFFTRRYWVSMGEIWIAFFEDPEEMRKKTQHNIEGIFPCNRRCNGIF